MDGAVWGGELGAGYVTDGLLKAYEEILEAWAKTPRWRIVKRHRLYARSLVILDCYFGIGGYLRQQQRLNRGYRDKVDQDQNGSSEEGMGTEPEGSLGKALLIGLGFVVLFAAALILVAIAVGS